VLAEDAAERCRNDACWLLQGPGTLANGGSKLEGFYWSPPEHAAPRIRQQPDGCVQDVRRCYGRDERPVKSARHCLERGQECLFKFESDALPVDEVWLLKCGLAEPPYRWLVCAGCVDKLSCLAVLAAPRPHQCCLPQPCTLRALPPARQPTPSLPDQRQDGRARAAREHGGPRGHREQPHRQHALDVRRALLAARLSARDEPGC